MDLDGWDKGDDRKKKLIFVKVGKAKSYGPHLPVYDGMCNLTVNYGHTH